VREDWGGGEGVWRSRPREVREQKGEDNMEGEEGLRNSWDGGLEFMRRGSSNLVSAVERKRRRRGFAGGVALALGERGIG